MNHKNLLWVMYDSITNSIFQGQVLNPLLKLAPSYHQVFLITFEPKILPSQHLEKLIPSTAPITIIQIQRLPFLGIISLYYAGYQLKKQLRLCGDYECIARGPFASWISKKSVNSHCIKLTLQARGLLAEECAYTHQPKNWYQRLGYRFKYHSYQNIEHWAYQPHKTINTIVEAVSPALQEYLIKRYHLFQSSFAIAKNDIPDPIEKEKIQQWRQQMRAKLSIPANAYVYCYNGSSHPWQCPYETISFFKEQYQKNHSACLLILSFDRQIFESLLKKEQLPSSSYRIITVPHDEIYRYLSAADAGIIFRKNHDINWTARPTKILEYQAIGLHIIHNNTIAWLMKEDHIYSNACISHANKVNN